MVGLTERIGILWEEIVKNRRLISWRIPPPFFFDFLGWKLSYSVVLGGDGVEVGIEIGMTGIDSIL